MVKYIHSYELAAIIQSDKKSGKDYLVVDVRDEDWVGGNIKGSRHIPSEKFLIEVDQLLKDSKDVPTVVFHCRLSQQRGPKAARIYEEARNLLHPSGEHFEVRVLSGGFYQFGEIYKDNPKLVENWRDIVW
ncbi:Rhodanese-like domain-containing protein [Scleroderma yunnanense]